jgi:TPR repeat protein
MVTAMAKLRPAAETGHVKSQVLLGVILDAAEFDEDAAGMFRRAADAGDAEGEFYLGSMYSNGEGVKKDEAEALRLLKSAADKGHQQALRVVAAAYADGMLGIGEAGRQSQDALSWIRRSADQEDSRALRTLAEAYRSGRFGLGTDAKMADELLAKANKIDRINEGKRRKERK